MTGWFGRRLDRLRDEIVAQVRAHVTADVDQLRDDFRELAEAVGESLAEAEAGERGEHAVGGKLGDLSRPPRDEPGWRQDVKTGIWWYAPVVVVVTGIVKAWRSVRSHGRAVLVVAAGVVAAGVIVWFGSHRDGRVDVAPTPSPSLTGSVVPSPTGSPTRPSPTATPSLSASPSGASSSRPARHTRPPRLVGSAVPPVVSRAKTRKPRKRPGRRAEPATPPTSPRSPSARPSPSSRPPSSASPSSPAGVHPTDTPLRHHRRCTVHVRLDHLLRVCVRLP